MADDPRKTLVAAPATPVPAGQDAEEPEREEVITAADFPVLSAMMRDDPGSPVVQELLRLLARAFKPRARRVSMRRIVRLSFDGYDETGLLKDVSTSGVRILVTGTTPLDLTKATRMKMVMGDGTEEAEEIEIGLVRLAGIDPPHIEIGCKFLAPPESLERIVETIRRRAIAPGAVKPGS